MVDMSQAHVWAWDARPWPDFPANLAVWSDGGNYARGHWITGRLGAQALADVVAETCEASFVEAYDISGLHGAVTGYVVPGLETARGALQPLMTSFAIDVIEQDGALVFRNRTGRAVAGVETEDLVWTDEAGSESSATRAPEAEVAGKLRLRYLRADGSYEMGAAEAVFPDEVARGVSTSEVPIVLTATEAQAIAARWLAESRVGREAVSLTLPPSLNAIGIGDVIDLPPALGGGQARIDRVEDVGARKIEGVRVEPTVYEPPDLVEEDAAITAFVPPVPVFPLFLDLPLLTGEEVVHAPHIAVTATPWPGSVALYGAPEDAGYVLNRLIERAAVIGVTETALVRAVPSRWDNGPGLRAKFYGGSLAAADPMAVLNGANVLAIGSGTDDVWEVLQFADAALVAENTYQLTRLLRGQGGTDGLIPDSWPVGSYVVALTAAVGQLDLAASARDLARHYRVGPAQRGYDDATYLHEIRAFSGVGLRPYAPCHLRASVSGGDYSVDWARRTRIDGDSWGAADVPLGESFERYQLRVLSGATIRREVTLGSPGWTYTAAMLAADGVSGSFAIEVAQVSERFGSGLFARIEINE